MVLLVGAGLLLASLVRLQRVDGGYDGDNVTAAEVFPNFSKYGAPADQQRFYEAALAHLEQQPGVLASTVTNAVPLSAIRPGSNPVLIKGGAETANAERPTADLSVVTPGYFAILDIPVLEGRDFTAGDTRIGAPVVIVNQTMAKHWAHGSALGGQISVDAGQTWATVVGVAGDVRQVRARPRNRAAALLSAEPVGRDRRRSVPRAIASRSGHRRACAPIRASTASIPTCQSRT